MSWPSDVVPSQCSLDGGSDGTNASWFGWSTDVNHPGAAANSMKTARMTIPITALRLRSALRNTPPRRRVAVGTASAGAVSMRSAVMLLGPRPRPRVEYRDRDVAEQQRDEHGDAEQHEECLHERVVGVLDGVVEHVAQARVIEDVLDEDRSRDHEAERHRET